MLVKRGLDQVNRLAGEQRLLALSAVGRAGKLVRTHAVGGLAMGADDVQGFAHTGQPVAGVWECKVCRAAGPETVITSDVFVTIFIAIRANIHWPGGLKHR